MTGLADIFAELGISHYLHDFIEQGFDTWDTILDITESDFDALGVKLGHRRKLQRKIANSRGLSSDRALASPRHTPSDDKPDEQRPSGGKTETKDTTAQGSGPHGAKRKYRRHPKPDENAPERPPSAYVIFSNKMREELKGRNLSFTEIAKLVGENWQNLSPGEKEPYEQQAFSAKERYNNELAEYKKTERYKEYSQYLLDFKSRHSNSQQGVPAENTEVESAKRPKLEAQPSTASSGTGSSNGSQHGEISTGRSRVESSASSTGQWHSSDTRVSPKSIVMPRLAAALAAPKEHMVPHHSSAGVLPGYRESIYGVPPQSLPWREELADGQHNLSQLASNGERRGSQASNIPVMDALNLTGSAQHTHRTGLVHGQPPPSLRSESTNRSTGSSASTVSSTYFSPRTPMEPPLERALPIPALYPQKNNFDSQLPSLRPASLSPQSSVFPQHSAHNIHPMVDYSSSMAPMRGYPSLPPQQNGDARMRDLMNSTYPDDNNNLDPVSALIRAGEVINRNSRNRQSP